jgi:hypothetical protein
VGWNRSDREVAQVSQAGTGQDGPTFWMSWARMLPGWRPGVG